MESTSRAITGVPVVAAALERREPVSRFHPAFWPIVMLLLSYGLPFLVARYDTLFEPSVFDNSLFDQSGLQARALHGRVCRTVCTALGDKASWVDNEEHCQLHPSAAQCTQCSTIEFNDLDRFCTTDGRSSLGDLHFMPFFPGTASNAWPVVLLLLRELAWPRKRRNAVADPRRLALAIWAGCFFAVFLITQISREFAAKFVDGRRVVSYTNWDVSRPSHCVMLLLFFVMAIFFARIWCLWLDRASDKRAIQQHDDDGGWEKLASRVVDPARGRLLAYEVDDWIRSSLILACACLPLSAVYWRLVAEYSDYRYLPPAIAFHVIWIATSCVVTLPVLAELTHQHELRMSALSALAQTRLKQRGNPLPPPLPKLASLAADFDRLRPVAPIGLLLAVLTSLASLVAPLVQLFHR